MPKSEFNEEGVREILRSDYLRSEMEKFASESASIARKSHAFRDRTGRLRASVRSFTALKSNVWVGYVAARYTANFVSNKAGRTANVKPVIRGVFDRTGTFRGASIPLFTKSAIFEESKVFDG